MIKVEHLTKKYTSGKGIFDVTFDVKEGEVFGFLGPNGAGKTTTIRQLLGFTNANEGICEINGLDTRKHSKEIHKNLGYLPGEIAFFDDMTGKEFMNFMQAMRQNKDNTIRNELIERFELEADRKIKKMSKGMKQKVALITTFMHNPDILILDEPTSGLDPLMQKRFIEFVLELKAQGKTILMSSHMFEEVERTCERVAIIKEGRIVAVEKISDLKEKMQKQYIVSLQDEASVQVVLNSNLQTRALNSHQVEVTLQNNTNEMLNVLSHVKVDSIDSINQSLEQIFISYYGNEETV
jgi:ABC-2 type transport system ATP-binding protein